MATPPSTGYRATAGAGDVLVSQAAAFPGMKAANTPMDRISDLVNKNPQAQNVWTSTCSSPSASTTYTYTIDAGNGQTVTVSGTTASGSPTAADLATTMATAHNANPQAFALMVASTSTADLILTARQPGITITPTTGGAPIGAFSETTAAAQAASVTFGVPVIWTSTDANGNTTGVIATSANMTAQANTYAFSAYVATEVIRVNIYRVTDGNLELVQDVQVTSATDLATTLAALDAAIDAAMPAATVIATSTTTSVTLTAEVVGEEWAFVVTSEGGGASRYTITETTNVGPLTSIHRGLVGIAAYSKDVPGYTYGSATNAYPANQGMRVATDGRRWVANTESTGPAWGGVVYWDGSDGSFKAAESATTVKLSRQMATWKRDSSNGVAELEIHANAT